MSIERASLLTVAVLAGWPCASAAQQALLDSPSRAFATGHQVTSEAFRPEHTASADMDGDGDPDLVVAHAGNLLQPKISVLFNQGDGGFGPPVNYFAPGQTMDVALADLDGDGDVDAAFAESDNLGNGVRALVYENLGDGTLAPYVDYTVGVGPTGIAATDVDLDGDVDLVTANFFWMQEDVTVLYNDGAGGFLTRVDFPIPGQNPTRVEAGDLTGDGAPDLVVALDAGNPSFAVLVNDGFGAFDAPQFHATGYTALYDAGVAIADVDLDGDRDVLFGTSTNGGAGYTKGFALFRNDGTGTLGAPESVPFGQNLTVLFDFAVADVTGDGWPDVLGTVKHSFEGFVLVPGDGAGGFGPPVGYRSGEYSRAVTTADVDGDGDLDAIVTDSASLTVTCYENDGSGFPKPTLFDVGPYIDESAVADIDLDGDLDLVSGDFTDFLVLRNQGRGSFVLERQPALTQKPLLRLRDLDGDGAADAILGGVARALNDGTGTFGPIEAFPVGTPVGGVDTLDMDDDGDLDLILTGGDFAGYGILTLENDGTGSFGAPTFFTAPGVTRAGPIVTGDFTGDGNGDAISGDWQTVWLWTGDGAGGFGGPVLHSLGSGGAIHLVAADLDRDGRLDVAGSHYGAQPEGSTLTVLFGNGDGTFAPPLTYLGMFSQWRAGIGGLTLGDVDGDGDFDLVGGCFGANDVAVFPNNGDRTFGPEQRYGVDGDVTWVAAGDFNGDGRAGVAANVANWTTYEGGITVLLTPRVVPPQPPRRASVHGRRPAGPISR